MRRTNGSAKGVVAVGFFVVVAGGLLVSSVEPVRAERTNGIMAAMYWVQPAIGEAIVEHAKLERGMTAAMRGAVGDLNRALSRQAEMTREPLAWVSAVRTWDAIAAANQDARVQYVMGRAIVNGTLRGIRAGLMPMDDRASAYTERMIGHARSWGMTMDEDSLAAREPNLGLAILESGQDWLAAAGHVQERLGRAIGKIAAIQDEYRQSFARNDEQMTALLAAVARTEARADVLAQLMYLDPAPAPTAFTPTEPISSPSRTGPTPMPVLFGFLAFALFFRLFLSVGRMGRELA